MWRQPRLPALPLGRLCLVSVPLVYTRSPLVSEILGDARLLCEIAKQSAGSVPSLSVYSTGGICRFMNACNIILCVCAHDGTLACVPICSYMISFPGQQS